jgi:HK97 family phage prohead protease
MSALELRRRRAEELHGTQERRLSQTQYRMSVSPEGVIHIGNPSLTAVKYHLGPDFARGGFDEVVMPGAFVNTIARGADVVLNVQHGRALSHLPIARTPRTLQLSETSKGLMSVAQLDPEDPDVIALQRKFARGDLDGQMSFAFRVPEGGDTWSDDYRKRTIHECDLDKGDVSIVVHGASPTTSSSFGVQRQGMPDHTTRARQRLIVMQRRMKVEGR